MTNKKQKSDMSASQKRLIPSYIFLTIVSILSVFPIYWMMTAATNNTADVARGKMFFGTEAATNFTNLVKETNLWQGMGNSFKYAAIQTILCLIVCSLAGYGFELYHDEKKDLLFGILLMGMMIPGVATMIPLFSMMSHLHLLNTSAGFVLPAVSTPFMIMMFRQNSRNFPVDIFEAARIDGLSEFAIFYKMYMPIMKATYAAAAVIIFMNAWNSYLWPRVVMTENKAQTMPILIANMANGYSVDYGKLMMGVLFSTIPTLVIFFVLQKRFTEGITGAVK